MAAFDVAALPLDLRAALGGLTSAQVADDQQWILSLLREQGLGILTLLWRMLGSEPDVLDAYQSAVCQLTSRGREAARANRAGYFYRTAVNAGISILPNRRRRQQQWPGIVEAHTRRDADRAESQSCERLIDQQQVVEQMREAIYQLPPHLRDVVLLRDLAELPYSEVAAVLGIRVSTARIYRHEALVRLAVLLGEEAAG